jgi:hypothetical protein
LIRCSDPPDGLLHLGIVGCEGLEEEVDASIDVGREGMALAATD